MLGDWKLDVLRALLTSLGSEQIKGTAVRPQRPRNNGVGFVCEHVVTIIPLWKWRECDQEGHGISQSTLTLAWSLPETSTLLDLGFRDGKMWSWSLVTFVLSVFSELLWCTKYCAKKARVIYMHCSSILHTFTECNFVEVLQLALEMEW